MKNLLLLLPALLIVGCGTTWPERDAAYWERYVEENKPHSDESVYFHPEGEVDRDVYIDEGQEFAFKFVEMHEGNALWVIEVDEGGDGFFIFLERWNNDGELLQRYRKLPFRLGDLEHDKLRDVLLDSGFLSIRSEFNGDGLYYWTIGVRADSDVKSVNFRGGYPNEARNAVYDSYDLIVKPRASKMGSAEVFETSDWSTTEEAQPLD
ncbi:MAG: hypothetical protein K8I27_14000 [Planctomycetes bacterium]|nr:hypothetical protein [Planctomycetota bacterium]